MEQAREIMHLLVETVQTHHQYQESQLKGEYNIQWSDWYATFLLENGLEELWGRKISQEELSALLVQLDAEYNSKDSHKPGNVSY